MWAELPRKADLVVLGVLLPRTSRAPGKTGSRGWAAQTLCALWTPRSTRREVGTSVSRYRAPELLLGTTTQTTSIDMW